jgi:hypothetical protein
MRHIVKTASEEGRTAKRRKSGAHHVVYGDDVRSCVVSAQGRDAVLRLSDLRDEVQRTLDAAPSLSAISRILLRKGFTTKQVEQYANDRSTPETKRTCALNGAVAIPLSPSPSHSTCIDASQHSSRCVERIRRNGRSCCDGMKVWSRLVCGRSELRQIIRQSQACWRFTERAQEFGQLIAIVALQSIHISICCLNLPSFLHLTGAATSVQRCAQTRRFSSTNRPSPSASCAHADAVARANQQ